MRLAIDFDGVLLDPNNISKGRRMGEPMEGAVEGMAKLHDAGHELIIATVRANRDTEHVMYWMNYYHVRYHSVVGKVDADLYVDDRGIKFTSWRELEIGE